MMYVCGERREEKQGSHYPWIDKVIAEGFL
jgi:hypothetical protein